MPFGLGGHEAVQGIDPAAGGDDVEMPTFQQATQDELGGFQVVHHQGPHGAQGLQSAGLAGAGFGGADAHLGGENEGGALAGSPDRTIWPPIVPPGAC